MEIQRKGDILSVKLDESCTIVDVEEHTQQLREALCTVQSGETPVRRLNIDAGQVQEADTAYLQLLLVAQAHMKKKGGLCSMRRVAPCISEALACYGIRL